MKTIYKIMIAFIAITMIITPAMGYEIYEQNDDQTSVWLTTGHPMPTGLDDMRVGYYNGDFPKGMGSNMGKDNPQ